MDHSWKHFPKTLPISGFSIKWHRFNCSECLSWSRKCNWRWFDWIRECVWLKVISIPVNEIGCILSWRQGVVGKIHSTKTWVYSVELISSRSFWIFSDPFSLGSRLRGRSWYHLGSYFDFDEGKIDRLQCWELFHIQDLLVFIEGLAQFRK